MDTAYANIGLDANTTWRDAPGDGFQKCSDKLWVKLNYLKEKKHHQVGEKGKVVTVHDVIAQSRLAQYGNYSYDNDREMMYNREKALQLSEELGKSHGEGAQEPWMLPEVEHEFRRLTRNCSQPYDLYNGFKPIDCVEVEESIQKKYPVLAKKCQPHAIDAEETLETIFLPNPFYRIDDLNQLELQMRITSTKHIWEHPLRNLMSLINTQKYSQQLRCGAFTEIEYPSERSGVNLTEPSFLPFFPPSSSSQSPPSQTPFVSSLRFIESIGDLSAKRSLRSCSRTSQLTESKTEILPVVKKRSSSEGHDFTNLTLLTRPINRQESCGSEPSAFQVPETVLKWLQTGYPTRSKEFSAIQNLSDELRSVRSTLQSSPVANALRDRQGKLVDGNLLGRKCEFSLGAKLNSHLDNLVQRSEQLSGSLSSSSSSEQSRPRNPKSSSSGTKLHVSPAPYSAVSSGGLSGSWQTQAPPLWSSRPLGILGLSPSELSLSRDGAVQKLAGKAKCRPILNSQYREVEDEVRGFEEGSDKKRFARGMADLRTFQCYGENSFDDLERQAIEQWPSDDCIDIFRSKHLQHLCDQSTPTPTSLREPITLPRERAPFKSCRKRKLFTSSPKPFWIRSRSSGRAKVRGSSPPPPQGRNLDLLALAVSVSVPESSYGNFSKGDKNQKNVRRDNRLEDKLRILLDFDSVDGGDAKRSASHVNIRSRGGFDKSTRFQHKSLPDLHASPYNSSSESSESSFNGKCDGDCRSAYSSITQPEASAYFNSKSDECRRCGCFSKNFGSPEFQTESRIYCSFRVTKSGEFIGSKASELESSCRRRSSNTSSCNRSRRNSSSKHSQSADSGRQSQGGSTGLRTGRSGLPEFSSPPPKSTWSDSGTEDDSPPLFRREGCDEEKKRPILRSKSDISYKYCASKPRVVLSSSPTLHSALPTTEKLEAFFDHLGMDPMDFKELASNSRNSSPVFFSSVSSIDSCVDLNSWNLPEPYKAAECPSIVERNARIVKWLYNCRKFHKTLFNAPAIRSSCDK